MQEIFFTLQVNKVMVHTLRDWRSPVEGMDGDMHIYALRLSRAERFGSVRI